MAKPLVSKWNKQTLRLIAEGKCYQDIAEKLCISIRTVQGRMWVMKKRYGCRTNAQLIYWALKKNIID
jgi:DNA-binding NarL/FixJ family response regulator